MSALPHEPQPLYAAAWSCGHIEPPEPQTPDEDDGQWAAWDADHPYGVDGDGRRDERICLDTQAGMACLACTDYAQEEYDLPTDSYILAADCTQAVTS
jgi:hypothetical protein